MQELGNSTMSAAHQHFRLKKEKAKKVLQKHTPIKLKHPFTPVTVAAIVHIWLCPPLLTMDEKCCNGDVSMLSGVKIR